MRQSLTRLLNRKKIFFVFPLSNSNIFSWVFIIFQQYRKICILSQNTEKQRKSICLIGLSKSNFFPHLIFFCSSITPNSVLLSRNYDTKTEVQLLECRFLQNKDVSSWKLGEEQKPKTKTYHDVAYKTNTLAAFPMAVLASLEMLTFSGSCNQKEAFVSKNRWNSAVSTQELHGNIQRKEYRKPKSLELIIFECLYPHSLL